MINTCAIWGTTTYVNSWLSINILVVVISLMAIAAAYSFSSFFPSSSKSKIKGFVRFEMIQMFISVAIIAALLAFSATACSVSGSISNSLSHKSMDPFAYSEYYISSTFNTGLTLLSNIYTTSITYAIASSGIKALPGVLLRGLNGQNSKLIKGNSFLTCILTRSGNSCGLGKYFSQYICSKYCEYESIPSGDFSLLYNMFSSIYLEVYGPILIISVGMLFIQFLAIPLMQASAFTIVLPVAIALRSISFFSSGLGDASNALIAIAIAMYIIYPMMVAFDGYAIAWTFTACTPTLQQGCNLSAQYAGSAFTVNTITPNSFLNTSPNTGSQATAALQNEYNVITSSASTPGSYQYWGQALNLIGTLHNYTDNMAQFFFQSILLFALNMAVTIGLGMSLYKALRSGLGEAGRFW
jgi:hypothetical protein